MGRSRGEGRENNGDEDFQHGSSSLEDEIDSTSSRDMNFSTAEGESLDNRQRTNYELEMKAAASDNSDDDGDGDGERTPQYRHSVTTNWSSSDEETENYRDRSSLFRRSETSSPDYFQPVYSAKGDFCKIAFL